MKRMLLILAIVAATMFSFTSLAFAENWYAAMDKVHYGFSIATESCSGCHVTHTAVAAKLLKVGRTQTEFCYSCHKAYTDSPYDVENGKIRPTNYTNDTDTPPGNSTAGKFGFYGGGVTSRHDVDSPSTNSPAYAANAIPGNYLANGNTGFPNGFKCGTCHDVHAGDSPNDRLLKNRIWDVQPALSNVVNFTYNSTSLVVEKYAVTANEINAINGYCGLCHARFNLTNDSAKQVVNAVYQETAAGAVYYRHAVGVSITANSSPNLAPYLGNPDNGSTAAGKNVVLCLTCHYAHGTTKAANTDFPGWNRENDAETPTGSGAALLRMDKRGVCYDCHGAASKNVEAVGEQNN